MKHDIDRLQLDLEYGQIIKFNNKYQILNTSDENFSKYEKIINDAEIALHIFLLRFHDINIKTSQKFLKFKIIKNPKKIQNFFKKGNIQKIIDINNPRNLDMSEKNIITIFKKLNILPFPTFIKKTKVKLKGIT